MFGRLRIILQILIVTRHFQIQFVNRRGNIFSLIVQQGLLNFQTFPVTSHLSKQQRLHLPIPQHLDRIRREFQQHLLRFTHIIIHRVPLIYLIKHSEHRNNTFQRIFRHTLSSAFFKHRPNHSDSLIIFSLKKQDTATRIIGI